MSILRGKVYYIGNYFIFEIMKKGIKTCVKVKKHHVKS